MKTILILIAAFLASCSSAPTMILSDGTKVNLGISLLENSTAESAKFTAPNGATLEYSKTGKNQTSGVTQLAGYLGTAYAVGQVDKQAITKSNNALAATQSGNAATTAQAAEAAKAATTTAAINKGATVAPITLKSP